MRGQTRRESASDGAPFKAAPTEAASLTSPLVWACAQAQLSARSGSSVAGEAGASIDKVASGLPGALPSTTPSCLRTTIRHSQGRSLALAPGLAGVNSQGK